MDQSRTELIEQIVAMAPGLAPYLHLDTTEQLREQFAAMKAQHARRERMRRLAAA